MMAYPNRQSNTMQSLLLPQAHESRDATLVRLVENIGTGCIEGARNDKRIVAALQQAAAWPDLLAADQRCPQAHGYARHLIHGDPSGRFTIVAIVWRPGQFSPIHAHHAWCAYAICEGTLQETLYAWDPDGGRARPVRTDDRPAGYGCYARAGLDRIHRLGNAGAETAISIHAYGVERERVATHVNRVVESV
jgi:predicted metal-dependent enzyme (double-stranded beta helix superfamily)